LTITQKVTKSGARVFVECTNGRKRDFERIQKGDEKKALEFIYKKYYRMMTKLVTPTVNRRRSKREMFTRTRQSFGRKARSGNLVLTSKKISKFFISTVYVKNLWRKELTGNSAAV